MRGSSEGREKTALQHLTSVTVAASPRLSRNADQERQFRAGAETYKVDPDGGDVGVGVGVVGKSQ